jgi:hypothetical protein
MKRHFYGFLVVFLMFLPLAGLFAQQKFALIIGNSNYTGVSKLTNPANDANDMTATLQSLGFTVDKVIDGDLEQMENAVTNLKRKLMGASRNSYGFFFYAGHGVQASDGHNYLIPVAANNIQNETHLRTRAVQLQFILDSLKEAGNELNMIVLDACRDNPFGWNRSGARGLSMVSNAPSGSIVMYAAASGQKADDGSGRNGLFTGHLLNNLKTAGLSVYEIFDKTMGDVRNITGGRQDPELSLRFSGANSVYLGSRPTPSTPVQTAQPAAPTPPSQPVTTGGTVTVNSEIAGEIFIDGQATGRRIKAGGTETISNVSTGSTEVWVKDSDGATIKAPTVMVRQGQTVSVVIERPIPEGLAFEIVDGKSVTITKYTGTAATVHIPEKIQGLPVTVIGDSAFERSRLSSVTIPSTVTSIGQYAFLFCENLVNITIPSLVTYIGRSAFSCINLASITVDSRNSAFIGIDGVLFDKDVKSIIKYPSAKKGAYSIPSSVTTIGDSAFLGCKDLTSITIPSSVTTIGNSAFYDCNSLTSITIPSSVTNIGQTAVGGGNSLTSIIVDSRNSVFTGIDGVLFDKNVNVLLQYPCGKKGAYSIPSSATIIGRYAFSNCDSLTSINIPSSVTTIGDGAFDNCYNLASINIPFSVTIIGSHAFWYCKSLTSIIIPSSVTTINTQTFCGCENLISISIPSSVTSIGYGAFSGCSNLSRISIPSSVTSIGERAFDYCSNLTNISIPSSVTTIGDRAFYYCSKLTSVTISRKTKVGEKAFPDSAKITYSD